MFPKINFESFQKTRDETNLRFNSCIAKETIEAFHLWISFVGTYYQ